MINIVENLYDSFPFGHQIFTSCFQYFLDYKLGKDHTNTDGEYATYFLNHVGFAAQIPFVLFNWVSVFVQFR